MENLQLYLTVGLTVLMVIMLAIVLVIGIKQEQESVLNDDDDKEA